MKIHLVTPANPPSFWTYDAILPTIGKKCIFPNLSMPTLAGLTPRDYEVTLCDENVEPIDFDVEADVVGVTGYIVHHERMLEIIDEFKRRGRFVVAGGPYASLCPEELRPHVDVLFVDEAEETWPEFLRDLEAGRWKTEYRPEDKPDMTSSPMPRFDLVDVDQYHAMTIQFARGCPFRCEFCDIIVVYGRKPRVKRVDQVMAEIEACRRLGVKQVFIVDDNFIGNKNVAKELLRAMAAWNREHDYPMLFNTEVSLNVAHDDELLRLLREANVTTIFIGIESPRVHSLHETKKTQNTRGDLVADVRRIQSYGIQVQAGMIVGFDADDDTIFDEQFRFIQDARIPVSMTGMLQAMPKTPLRERVEKEGRLVDESSGDQFVFSNIVPKAMTRLELFRGYRELIQRLYDYDAFRRRTVDFILERGERVKTGLDLRTADLSQLGRAFRETLGTGGARARFTLRMLGEVLRRRPGRLRDAVSMAVLHKGLHDYMGELVSHLDAVIADMEAAERAAGPLARRERVMLGRV